MGLGLLNWEYVFKIALDLAPVRTAYIFLRENNKIAPIDSIFL